MTTEDTTNIKKAYAAVMQFEDPTSTPPRTRYKAAVYFDKAYADRWLDWVCDPEWLAPARVVSRDVVDAGEFDLSYTSE